MNLKERFLKQLTPYQLPETEMIFLWQELIAHYESPKRHYHNAQHLEALFLWIDKYQAELQDIELVQWAIWYHDIIYRSRRRDNEEQSAIFAQARMAKVGFSQKKIATVMAYIRATAQHLSVEANGDLAYFLDFDLAILGTSRSVYEKYTVAVRKEYAQVPGFLYRRGRKKVLHYFLASDRLYRTKELHDLLEERAVGNLQWELKTLGG